MTENHERKDDNTSVQVAIRVRPQNAKERIDICQVCTTVPSNEPQVLLGKDKSFTFDHVYDMGTVQETIYDTCVRHLIDGCFDGYNATVFAYGQTGSGKTYTMGTGFDVNTVQSEVGIIPRAVDHLFQGIESRRKEALANDEPPPDFRVNAQFMELYNEEILDLLDTTRDPESRGRKSHIKIHEDAAGGIYVVGVTTRTVVSLEDTMKCLNIGALSRATASTNMNVQSSRSHAIFTLHIKQHRMVKEEPLLDEGKDTDSTQSINEFETLTAKFHFVDLAGSERLKRTGATGERAKEGISINCGLLALGNVISALGDKLKKGSHVPYRDSKLTRLLQDSLGGNSRTLMIACISPSDRDFMETLNTLKYANRAKNIKNKVIANQDKASKQMAALRAEIAMLQQELVDYKAGKLVVTDGVASMSDMHHENNMLLMENDKLRQRVKALNDTVETLKARNSQLLAEKAVLSVTGANGEASNEAVTNLITGYVKELEDLRAKLAESASMVTQAQKYSARSPSRLMVSPMSTSFPPSGVFDYPLSPDNSVMALIDEAKKDVKKLKKVKRSKSRQSNQGSDKENEGEEGGGERPATEDLEENREEAGEVEHEESQEKSEDEEDDEEDIEDGNEEDTTEDEVSSSESDSDDDKVELFLDYGRFWSDSDHIHEDLAELTCEITIKQRLIEELEHSQKKVHAIKQQYEEKVIQLQQRIKETEIERDKVLANVGQLESESNDKQKKVKDEFAKKLTDLQLELKKMQAAKREHAKMVRNQSHFEKQLKTLQHEMQEMKKTKVRLMKQIKEDGEKNKQSETRRNKEIAQMRREFTRKENRIRNLEREKNQKEQVLRRKQEEVEALRKRQKPLSSRAAGRIGKYEKAPTIPIDPISTSSPRRRRRNEFSPKAAKQKWDIIEKNVGSVITRRQTISHMEKDMDVWLKQREKLSKKLEKFVKKRDSYIALQRNVDIIRDMGDQIQSLKNQIEYVQDNINECQTNIMQMEEAKEETENLDVGAVISTVTLEEAKYLLDHFLQLSINKGMALALKDSESKELLAKLHQTELNNTLQQDLLKHMMIDHVDIEVDNLMSNNDELDEFDIESCTTSASSSPAESMLEAPLPPVFVGPPSAGDIANKKEKARRKTATPEDLLYAGGPQEGCPPLLPVLETPDEDKEILYPVKEELEGMSVNGTDTILMPPPKSQILKPNSSIPRPMSGKRPDSGPSPSLRRKEFKRNSPEPSPVMRRKNYSDRYGSRSSSIHTVRLPRDTSSDTTPPTSPPALRRSGRNSDENVFSRLTSNPQSTSPNPNRGSIVSVSGRPSSGRSSPLTCTHTAEGHTKAVLAVHATDELLFTGSKDRTAKTWDLATGKEILAYTGHPNNVGKVKYCEATKLTFTVSQSFIKVWDIRSKSAQCIKTLGSSGLSVTGPANQTYQSRQTDLAPGEHHINDIALGSDGVTLYCATGNIVRVWDLRRYSAVGKLSGGHQAAVMVLAVDASTDSSTVITGSKDHYIKVFEVLDEAAGVFTPKYNLDPPHYDGIQSLALHGSMLFSGSRDTCIKKWDLKDQQLKQSMNAAHKDWVCALDFMPGGNFLLSACRGGTLKLWQMDSCAQIAEIKAHSSPINAIATNSTSIFTASNDNTVAFWKHRTTTDPSDISDFGDEQQGVTS
ncbi:kinesin-like protein KIF21A isoform X1 [Haliotis cracherodii]|uniref:kinesin-like protein KIF21A isoform X1 n=1 Tax=Haliotis cracherodii TaxID=6455 RepID=UPI0039ECF79A